MHTVRIRHTALPRYVPELWPPVRDGPRMAGDRHNARSIGRRPLTLDANLWTRSDRVAGISSAVLLFSLFLPWFGITLFGASVMEDGLTSHGYLRIVLIVCLVILGYLVVRISPMRPALPPSRIHELLLLAATAVVLPAKAVFNVHIQLSGS